MAALTRVPEAPIFRAAREAVDVEADALPLPDTRGPIILRWMADTSRKSGIILRWS